LPCVPRSSVSSQLRCTVSRTPPLKYEREGISKKEKSIEEENRLMSVNDHNLNIRFFAAVLYRDIIILRSSSPHEIHLSRKACALFHRCLLSVHQSFPGALKLSQNASIVGNVAF